MSHAVNSYGNGHACERIADILEEKEQHLTESPNSRRTT